MSEAKAVTIGVDKESCRITDFEIRDPDVVRYFADTDEDKRQERFETALRAGVLALQSAETTDHVDHVEKRFEQLNRQFEARMEAYFGVGGRVTEQVENVFGEDGEFHELLDEHFGEDGELVAEVFDPSNSGTPMNELRDEIQAEFEELRAEIGLAEREAEMVEQTSYRQGDEFESEVHRMLSEMAQFTGDRLEHTGTREGSLANSKTGDFVVTLGKSQARIVFEAKSADRSQPQIEEEMERAIENRNADFGVFVARDYDNIPNKIGWFNEYGSHLVLALGDERSEEFSEEMLHIGYKWARMRALELSATTSDELDTESLRSDIEEVRRSVEFLSSTKSKCKKIQDTAETLRADLNDLQDNLDEQLEAINERLIASAEE